MILCNVRECLYWKELSTKRKLRYGKVDESFSDYEGFCVKKEIGVRLKEIETWQMKYRIPECVNFATTGSRHTDWSRFPQGDLLDDDYGKRLVKEGKARKL